MKNLTPLIRKIAYWDQIVNNKNLVDRVPLQAIRQDVYNRFVLYTQHTAPINLESIQASTFIAPNIDLLKGCYSKSNGLSKLKTKIHEKQSVLLRSECQYCNIGEPSTFDHYLPQKYFPEFSALSINLIPCCATCNTNKGEEWILLGRRKIINYYFDILPNVNYLDCSIVYKKNMPQASFSLNTLAIPVGIRPILTNHFNALNLLNRYREKSNSEITDVFNAIVPLVGLLTRAQIVTQLRLQGAGMKVDKGDNYWRAILKIALSNSGRFLNDAGY